MSEAVKPDDGFSLLRLAPPALRARGFRLYSRGKDKPRLVDLWQNGGAAILGHAPPAQSRELKNAAARGLFAPLPHFTEGRYLKALSEVFPDRDFRLYAAPPPGLEALVEGGTAALWRPFLDPRAPLAVGENAPPILIPVAPGVQGWREAAGRAFALPLGLCVLAVVRSADEKTPALDRLPPGDLLPPVALAVAARGLRDLIAAARSRANPAFPRVERALRRGAGPWRRRGPYLEPARPVSRGGWAALFRRFLDAGFLLPPVPFQPAILPAELSPGEEAKLANSLETAFDPLD